MTKILESINIEKKNLYEYVAFYNNPSHQNLGLQLTNFLKNIKSDLNKTSSLNSFKNLKSFFESNFKFDGFTRFSNDYFQNTELDNIASKVKKIEDFIMLMKKIEDFPGKIIIESDISSDSENRGFIETLFGNNKCKKIEIIGSLNLNTGFQNCQNIRNLEVKGELKINKTSENIVFTNSTFKGGINIQSNNKKGQIKFSNCDLLSKNKNYNLSNIECEEICIEQGKIRGVVNIEGVICKKIKILNINNSGKKHGKILLHKIKNTAEITIGGVENRSNIESLEFSKVFNTESKGLILLYNLNLYSFLYHGSTIIPKLSISGVYFNNLEFSEIDLGKAIFNKIEIRNLYLDGANLSECIFNDIDFSGNYTLKKHPIERINIKKIIQNSTARKTKDNYRQLKYVMDKNGNHTEANKFYALEMESELQSLKESKIAKSWKDYLSLDFYISKGDNISSIIVLTISKILNSYGNNWLGALIWLMTLAFFSSLIKLYYKDFINNGLLSPTKLHIERIHNGGEIVNFINIFLHMWILFLLAYLLYKIESWLISKAPGAFIIIFSLILIFFFDFDLINTFLEMLLNPLHGFRYLYGLGFNTTLELLGFTIYKILYGLILWHIIVAVKRTTKR